MWQKFYVDYHPDAPSFFIGLETRNKLVELINAHLIRRLRVQKEVRAKTICKMYLCTPFVLNMLGESSAKKMEAESEAFVGSHACMNQVQRHGLWQ